MLTVFRRARAEAPPHEVNMTVSKPKSDRFTDHTQRNTDPLQPSYYIHGSSYSEIDRNHPSKLRNEITDSKLLRTDDIEGAQAGYVTKHRLSIPEDKRREYRNINYLDDIDGAHADTIKHSIRTTRSINPLVPLYQSLDGDILSGPIDSLVPHHLIDQKSDFKSYGTVRGNSVKTQQPSRHNLFSRSGNSVMSPSSSIQHFPPHSPSKDGDYYSYQHNENTGGIALADFTLAQSKSYAEKYFPQVLSPNNSSQTTGN